MPNVWLGTSVETQETANERIPLLLETPAAVRFLSCEPLLGPIDLNATHEMASVNMMDGGIDWVIAGGESGPHYRLMDIEWARSLRDQCVVAGVSFFYKQDSGRKSGMNPTLDGQEWHEFPRQLESRSA